MPGISCDHGGVDDHDSWCDDAIFQGQYQPQEDAFIQRKYVASLFLAGRGIRTPRVLAVYRPGTDDFPTLVAGLPETFVLKPDLGQAGQQVYVLRRSGDGFTDQQGTAYAEDDLQRLCRQPYREAWMVPFAPHNEIRLFCERIVSHPRLASLYRPDGFIDFRLYFIGGRPAGAFMRVPTDASKGLGNYCQGAQIFNLDARGTVVAETGLLIRQSTISRNDGRDLAGFVAPCWDQALAGVSGIPGLFRSKLVCIDGTIDAQGDFVVVEITLKPTDLTTRNGEVDRLIAAAPVNRRSILAEAAARRLLQEAYRTDRADAATLPSGLSSGLSVEGGW
jgi:hypothetical protein